METSPVTDRIGKLMRGTEGEHPRALQLAFALPSLACMLVWFLLNPEAAVEPVVMFGALLLVATTVAAYVVSWDDLPVHAPVVLPVIDMAAVGLLHLGHDLGSLEALAVLPAMWLGVVYRFEGVVVATFSSLLLVALPGLVAGGPDAWLRLLMVPLICFAVANSLSMTADVWLEQRDTLEAKSDQLEVALRESREQRRLNEAILQTVDIGLLALRRDGSVSMSNRKQREITARIYPASDGIDVGEHGFAFAADGVTPLERSELPTVRAMAGHTFSGLTMWVGEEPGSRRAISVSARPMFHAGMFNGAVLAFQDITTLMRALRVKDDFVASVSHELRTPLTSIMGYVDMVLEQEPLTERMERSLNVVMRNAERLLLLVSDLLMTAQAESGTLSMKSVPTDLAQVVSQCVDSAIPRAEAAGVRLEARLGPLPQMEADPDRLDQVVTNLISNAIKYTPKGGEVTVSLEQVGDSALITVRDTGIGISSADQKSLFVRFFRASAVEKRAMPGVGLGLVITKAIVEAHGGGIEVTSEEGRGTTVYVGLPLRRGERQVADSAAGANR